MASRAANIADNRQRLNRAYSIVGDECLQCGHNDREVLTFDHTANDGAAHRKRIRKTPLAWWIVNNPAEAVQTIQVLCANCHIRKTRAVSRITLKLAA